MRIAVFDSGVGGITVLRALQRRYPEASYVYLGDTAHVPYGSRTPATIRRLCVEALAKLPRRRPLNALVIACNTASSVALMDIRNYMKPLPVFGVVKPGARAAVQRTLESGLKHILLLGTRATLGSGAYQREIRRLLQGRSVRVTPVSCPMWVPMIEDGITQGPLARALVEHYVRPWSRQRGVAVLACTHYPWIRETIQSVLPRMEIVDSAEVLAEDLGFLGVKRRARGNRRVQWVFTDPGAVEAARYVNP